MTNYRIVLNLTKLEMSAPVHWLWDAATRKVAQVWQKILSTLPLDLTLGQWSP